MSLITRVMTAAAAFLVLHPGCGDDGGGGTKTTEVIDNGDGTTIFPDAEAPPDTFIEPDTYVPPEDTVVSTEPLKIDFVTAVGDDNVACKGKARCVVSMSFNSDRDLEVKVFRGATPVGDVNIRWTITKNPGNALKLGATTSASLPEGDKVGVALANVKQTTPQSGQYEVKAEITGSDAAPDATPLFFDVVVTAKGVVPLTVTYKYDGERKFQGVTTYLFKQGPGKAFPCADMDPKNLPTADTSGGPKAVDLSTSFPSLPDLNEEGSQIYTIVGIGKDVSGPSLVWGCDDTKATVTSTGAITVPVTLKDLPPLWKRPYEVTTKFDLLSALPDNVEKYVKYITGLFTDPAATLLVVVCDVGGGVSVIAQLCDFAFVDPANPCMEDKCFDTIGLTIKDLMGNLLEDLIEKSEIASSIFDVGKDVSNILTGLELGAIYEIKAEPMTDGTIPSSTTMCEWNKVTYRWALGTDCATSDDDCAKHTFNMAAFQGGTVTGTWSGRVDYPGTDYLLTIDPHSLNIKYGALLLHLVEKEILPIVAGNGDDGYPKIDSIDEYLKTLLGGKECLKLEFEGSDETCCKTFAENLTNSTTGGFTTDIAEQACELGIPLVTDQLRKVITDLDLETGNGFTLATKEACACYDHDANLNIDAWGKGQAEPCHWDTTIQVGGTQLGVENDFWAIEPD